MCFRLDCGHVLIQVLFKQSPLDLRTGAVPENVVGTGILLNELAHLLVTDAEIFCSFLHTQRVLSPNGNPGLKTRLMTPIRNSFVTS